MTIAIVGAGVVGTAQALYAGLRHAGRRIVVLDPGGIGQAASLRNSGYLCPGLAAEPPDLASVLRYHARHRLRTHDIAPAQLGRWAAGAVLAAGGRALRGDQDEGLRQLRAWAERSGREWPRLLGGEPPRGAVRLRRRGPAADLRPLRRRLPALDLQGVRDFAWCPEDTFVDAETCVHALAQRWPPNVEWRPQAVRRLGMRGGRVQQLHLEGAEPLAVAQVVLATGAGTAALLRPLLRSPPPLLPLCGYSLTVQYPGPPPAAHAISDLDQAATLVPLSRRRLRIAGYLDLAGVEPPWAAQRHRQLEETLRRLFPEHPFEVLDRWHGIRIGTVSGIPLVGRVGENVYCNAGHGRVGMTLAPGTAAWLSEQL